MNERKRERNVEEKHKNDTKEMEELGEGKY